MYEITSLGEIREFPSAHGINGIMYSNTVTVLSSQHGQETAEINTKVRGVLKVGDQFEAERNETKFGLKLKRQLPNAQGAQPSAQPAANPKKTYEEVALAYQQFAADMAAPGHATTLFMAWMRGEFSYTPPASHLDSRGRSMPDTRDRPMPIMDDDDDSIPF